MLRRVGQATVVAIVCASALGGQTLAAADTGGCLPTSVAARAQSPDSVRTDTARRVAPPGTPLAGADHGTVVLFASASAREVQFRSQPRIVVRLCGAVTDSVHVIERRNLPERVQPGVTYRDVYIAVEIIGHLNAECLGQRIGTSTTPAASRDCAYVTVRDSTNARRSPP